MSIYDRFSEKRQNFIIRVDLEKGEKAASLIPSNKSDTVIVRELLEDVLGMVVETDKRKREESIEQFKNFLNDIHNKNYDKFKSSNIEKEKTPSKKVEEKKEEKILPVKNTLRSPTSKIDTKPITSNSDRVSAIAYDDDL